MAKIVRMDKIITIIKLESLYINYALSAKKQTETQID